MPIKLFTDGEILDAGEVNTYFMDQAVCVFESAADRNDAFGGTDSEGVPNEPVLQPGRICYLKDDQTLYIYTSTGWSPQLAFITDGAVTTIKLDETVGSEAVTTEKIRNLAVTTGKLANNAVTSAKLGTDLSLSGSTSIEEIFEKASIVAAQPVAINLATLTLTITDGAVYYYTVTTNHNIVLDIITTGLEVGEATTLLVAITSNSTSGKISSLKVNSATPTIKWFGGNAYPNGSGGNAVDAYTITVFRSASEYTVFASQSKFA